jgi:hypothetical protein
MVPDGCKTFYLNFAARGGCSSGFGQATHGVAELKRKNAKFKMEARKEGGKMTAKYSKQARLASDDSPADPPKPRREMAPGSRPGDL